MPFPGGPAGGTIDQIAPPQFSVRAGFHPSACAYLALRTNQRGVLWPCLDMTDLKSWSHRQSD